MAVVDEYDEAGFLRRLEPLGRSSKTAFAAACAERLWPMVERYASAAAVPAGRVVALRAALDALWRSCLGGSEDVRSVQVLAESMVPREGDHWVFEAGYGQNAIAAVAYAARTWLTDDPQEAVWAARQVYEAADYGAQRHAPEVTAYRMDVEDGLHLSPAVRGAVNALAADLEAAVRGDPLSVQEQSRAGAVALADLLP